MDIVFISTPNSPPPDTQTRYITFLRSSPLSSDTTMSDWTQNLQERLPSLFSENEQNIDIQNPPVDTSSIHSPVIPVDTEHYVFGPMDGYWDPNLGFVVQGSDVPLDIFDGNVNVGGGSSILDGGYYYQSPQSPSYGSPNVPDVNSPFTNPHNPQEYDFSPIASPEFASFANLDLGSPGGSTSMDSDTRSYYDLGQSPQTTLIGSPNYSDVNFGAPQGGAFLHNGSQFPSPETVYSGASPNSPLAAPILSPFLVPSYSAFPAALPPDDLLGPSLQRVDSTSHRHRSRNARLYPSRASKLRSLPFRQVTDNIVKIMSTVEAFENDEPTNREQQTLNLQQYLATFEASNAEIYRWVTSRRRRVGKQEGKKPARDRRTVGEHRKFKCCLWCNERFTTFVNLTLTGGPPKLADALLNALAMDTDSAIHVEIPESAPSPEPLTVAKILKQATDDDLEVTGQMFAGLLGWAAF
ncbi:hypothetical protein CVT24_004221 [Panaeolus cyanescens]|uniref:Uncharacterized protein n=1 Tax=Panaeolus cyanescens TaxID=181874 RepID=A0A409YSX6_9AGAR|nr:hypothetical protein CVT24_004221 [Panaeolus cyanescens]